MLKLGRQPRVTPGIAEFIALCDVFSPNEAEALALTFSPESGYWYDIAQASLCKMYLCQARNEEAVRTGRALIAQKRHTAVVVEHTMLALHVLGRRREARETLELVREFGHSPDHNAYQRACFASCDGRFPEALRWLEIEAGTPRFMRARSIGDSDLLPLWRWLPTGIENIEDAHRLMRLPLRRLCKEACDPHHELEMDQNDLKHLSPEFARLFEYSHAARISVLQPMAAAQNPDSAAAFRQFRGEHIAGIVNLIEAGYARALDLVLAAQPQYAAEQAAWNNHLGVRYHLTWALAYRPEMLASFRLEPGMASMMPLLDSFDAVLHLDPNFCRRMEEIHALWSSDPDRIWQALEAIPAGAREHPLYFLRRGLHYTADGDHKLALPFFLRVCESWPTDAAGFSNAIDSLMKLGEWEDAARLLSSSPVCYRRFQFFDFQRRCIADRQVLTNKGSTPQFQGQRDLGIFIQKEAADDCYTV